MRERISEFRENLRSLEIPRTEFYPVRLAIYGRPGTGQSALAEELERRSGIQLHRAGMNRREKVREETGEEIIGHHPAGVEGNRNIDDEVKREFLEATEDNKVIIDAKLSNIIGRELGVEFTGILVVARADVRYKRIQNRQIQKHMEETGLSRKEAEKLPQFSLKAIKSATLEREEGNKREWKRNHPQIGKIDIFNPGNKDNKGNPIFHFYINTTRMAIEESADLVEAILFSKYQDKQKRQQEEVLPQSGVIFPQ